MAKNIVKDQHQTNANLLYLWKHDNVAKNVFKNASNGNVKDIATQNKFQK